MDQKTARANKGIRRVLKAYLHYESTMIKVDNCDPTNHNGRIKLVRHLQNQRQKTEKRQCHSCFPKTPHNPKFDKDIRFRFLGKAFLVEKFPAFTKYEKPILKAPARYFSNMRGHTNSNK